MREPMARPPRDDEDLTARLAELAAAVIFPPTPPLSEMVGARLRQAQVGDGPGPALRPIRDRFGWTIGRGLALALLAILVLAGAALAFGIMVGGLRLTFAPGTPSPLPSGVAQSRAFGSEVDLQAAKTRAGFRLALPSLPGIGAPDHVYYNDFPTGGTVSLAWGSRPGYSADPTTGLALVVTEFKAIVDASVWEKILYKGTTVIQTQVDGRIAYWVAGGQHAFFYRDGEGKMIETSLRLVGNALVWQRGDVVLRIEGASSLAAAVEVARSIQ